MLLLKGTATPDQACSCDYPETPTPIDLRELIEDKIGFATDQAFGELCGFVERLSRTHSHAIQRAALTPLLPANVELTITET